MPKRVAVNKIIVVRDGKRLVIKPNHSFDFSAAELKDIPADALRKANNEEETIVEVKAPPADEAGGLKEGTKVGSGKTANTKLDVSKASDKDEL